MTLASDRFIRAADRPLSSLATTLTVVVGAPVIDRTGLDGKFDYSLEWMPDPSPTDGAAALPLAGLFTALQEQLGLKLEPGRGPVDVLVVDAVERPEPD